VLLMPAIFPSDTQQNHSWPSGGVDATVVYRDMAVSLLPPSDVKQIYSVTVVALFKGLVINEEEHDVFPA
jgi:hypothetical protein